MRRVRIRMLRNFFVINIILVVLLGFLGYKFYGVATYSMDVPDASSVEAGDVMGGLDVDLSAGVPDKASFNIISRNNLFRPSRSAFRAGGTVVTRTGKEVYPKLFATIILGDKSTAIMEDPDTRKTKRYSVNDIVAGLQLIEILQDRVVLSRGGERIEVKLRDDKGIKSVRAKPLARKNEPQRQNKSKRRIIRRRPVPPPPDSNK